MWSRPVLKEKAKAAFARSRWGLILCGLILMIVSGGFGGGTSGANTNALKNQSGTGSAPSGSAADYANMFGNIQNGDFDAATLGVIAAAILGVVVIAIILGILLDVFICNPLKVGCYRYFLEASFEARTAGQMGIVGHAFKKGRYGNVAKTMFLMDLYIVLWSLLFVIPGIIKTYEYRMLPYILAENPEISSKDAFALTKEMMNGNKWAAFVLDLSFIGWHLLSILTCGILEIFYVVPYEQMTDMYLYDTLKQNASIPYFDKTLGESGFGGYSANSSDFVDPNAYTDADRQPSYDGDQSQDGWMPVYSPDNNSGNGDSGNDA